MSTVEDLEEGDDEDMPPPPPPEEENGRSRLRTARVARDSDDASEVPPFLDRSKLETLNDKKLFDYPGRSIVDLDKEINNRNRLYGAIAKLRYDDEAQVVIERVLPETWEGVSTKGFSDRFHVNAFQTADDLLDLIKRTFGGYLYQCIFSAPNKAGEMKTITRCKVHINAPPVVSVAASQGQGTHNNGHGNSNPSMALVDKVFETQQKIINEARGEKEDPRMLAQFANMMREMRTMSENANKDTIGILRDQIQALTKQSERADKPDAGLIKFTSEQAVAERDRLQSRFDMEKTSLINQHNLQLENSRRDHKQDLDNMRRDKESEITRLMSQLSALENQHAMMKLSLETNFNTQLSNMKSTYENQIANMKSGQDLNTQLSISRISTLESQVKTLEQIRDQLQQERITALTTKPDSLTEVSRTLAAVKEIAGGLGMTKDQAPQESEIISTLKGLKDIGVGETLGKIADRFAGARQQQPMQQQMQMQPMGTFNVPVDAMGRPLVSPQQAQAFAQQQAMQAQAAQQQAQPPQRPRVTVPHPPPPHVNESLDDVPSPQVRPRVATPHVAQEAAPVAPAASQTAPAEAPELSFDPDTLRPVAGLFERAMNEGWPLDQFAAEIIRDLPRPALESVINAGSTWFLNSVEQVVPESDLTSVRGTEWLGRLFHVVRSQLEALPPPA